MRKLMYFCAIVAMVISFLLAACGAPAEQPAPTQTPASDKPQYGGTMVRLTTGSSPRVLGYPPEVAGLDFMPATPAVETLLRADEKGWPTPFLATAWEVSPDRKSAKFTLRKNVKFQDGTDFPCSCQSLML